LQLTRAVLPALLLIAGSAGCGARTNAADAGCDTRQAATGADGSAASFCLPMLTGRIVDGADLLGTSVEGELDTRSAALERKTSDQLVVVTTPDLEGRRIEAFGLALGRGWGVGQKSLNNGVLLIIAPKERQVRIEVGYGLEGLLTDARAKQIIDQAMLPQLRKGDYEAAARAGVHEIVETLESDIARPKPRAAKAQA
jgi:uncharacterized protein